VVHIGDGVKLILGSGKSLLRKWAPRPARVAVRRVLRRRPLRPPIHSAEEIAALNLRPETSDFITGNGIARHCRYVLNWDALRVNEEVDNDWWFCRPEWLEYFFRKLAPSHRFVLVTTNSDASIGPRAVENMDRRPQLVAWFGANVTVRHPKLFALPLGISDPHWPHGNTSTLKEWQRASVVRERLFDANFDPATNPAERQYCIEQTGLVPGPREPFAEYLGDLKASYFCLSPAGDGIDTHRTWEALYLRTVPVVTRSILTEQHPDLPMVVLDDWAEFSSIAFSPELYEDLISGWDPGTLTLDRYLERARAKIQHLPA
jgi:hypothetical protein